MSKTQLAVAALENGTVIDRIPSASLFKAVKILDIANAKTAVTIGNNLSSKALGTKGIIKVAGVEYPENILDQIAFIAPSAIVNIIRDYEVVEKRPVTLQDDIYNLVRCDNPKCVTNHEPMPTKFHVIDRQDDGTVIISCHYCNHVTDNHNANLL